MSDPLLCQLESCAHPIMKREGESPHSYSQRKFCSVKCAHIASKKRLGQVIRRCEQCGLPIVRKAREDHHRFLSRRFCDRVCKGKAQRRRAAQYVSVDEYLANVGVTQCPTVHLIAPDHMRPNYGVRSRRTQ